MDCEMFADALVSRAGVGRLPLLPIRFALGLLWAFHPISARLFGEPERRVDASQREADDRLGGATAVA